MVGRVQCTCMYNDLYTSVSTLHSMLVHVCELIKWSPWIETEPVTSVCTYQDFIKDFFLGGGGWRGSTFL